MSSFNLIRPRDSRAQYCAEMMKLSEILPDGKSGDCEIDTFVLDAQKVQNLKRSSMFSPGSAREYFGIQEGTYKRLLIDGQTMMSNTWMEQRTNLEFVEKATGHVLIAGLGIGMILVPILNKPDVLSVTVIEKSPDVISLVAPYFVNDKLKVVQADIFDYIPDKKYDVIYFDIWLGICSDNWEEMKSLERRYRKYLNKENPQKWMGCWRKEDVRLRAKEERREERYAAMFSSSYRRLFEELPDTSDDGNGVKLG